jgi:AcrR family transcriptional regulator
MVTRKKHQQSRKVTAAAPRVRTGGRSARVVRDVLAAALEVFAEQGYAGLSIENVAARAGVNKTTVYRRWPSKPELVGAALFRLRDEGPETPDSGSLGEDLFLILQHLATQMVTPRRRAIMHALLLGNGEPELQQLVQRLKRERPAIPHVVIERAVRRGELPKGSSAELIALALLGPLHNRAYWKREALDDAFLRSLIRLVLYGAASGGARPD